MRRSGELNVRRSTSSVQPGLRLAYALVQAALLSLLVAPAVHAQETRWQPAVRVYETEDRIVSLLLLGDGAGRLHLLWGEVAALDEVSPSAAATQPASPGVIYYSVLGDDGWSAPMDVLVEPAGSVAGLHGAVDGAGFLHVVYGMDGPLRYARSLTPAVASARDWSAPATLVIDAQTGGSITVNGDGQLQVTYGAVDRPVQLLSSGDGGANWIGPMSLTRSPVLGQATAGPLLAYGPPAVWRLAWNEGMPGELAQGTVSTGGGFYASSVDGVAWSRPLAVTAPQARLVALAVEPAGAVHVLFSGVDGVGGRYHRWSPDGGANWSEPRELVEPAMAANFSPGDMALDGAGTLHAFFTAVDGKMAAHAERARGQWSAWRNLAPSAPADTPGMLAGVAVEVTLGNQVHAAWRRDDRQIWVAQGVSSAAALDRVAYVTPVALQASPAAGGTPVGLATPALPTATPAAITDAQENAGASSPSGSGLNLPSRLLLLLAVLPTLLLLGGVLLWQVRRRD